MALVRVDDYKFPGGWSESAQSTQRAHWCCEQLEASNVLLFPEIPFDLPPADIEFLLSQTDIKDAERKNIKLGGSGNLSGVQQSESAERLQDVMRNYSREVTQFLSRVLAPYSADWKLHEATFRPEQEKGRDLKTLKRNDLLHTDAFKRHPTFGGRIMRCFTNINPHAPRVWNTTDAFPVLAEKYAQQAGLQKAAPTPIDKIGTLEKLRGKKSEQRSAYDSFMLSFHDFLKLNEDYQQRYPKEQLEFPPNATWICFTDSVPHAAVSGQFALEQTLIIPLRAMVSPERAPVRVLEKLAGRALLPAS